MNDPAGTTTSFGFLGFFASLFPRIWPLAISLLLEAASEMSGWVCATRTNPAQIDNRPLHPIAQLFIQAVVNWKLVARIMNQRFLN